MLASYLFVATVIVTLAFRCETTFAENDLPVRDMVRIVGDVTVEEGQVVKDAVAIVGSVTVLSGGRVMGNAVAIGGDVHLKANARVEGDTVSIGGEILKEEGASVGGNDVAIGSVAKHLVPAFGKWRQIISSTIRQSALKSGGWGVGSMVVILLLLILTTGSLLGIVLFPVLVVAVAVVAVLGCVASGLFVGERTVSASAGSLMKPFLVGMLILAAIGLVPLVGSFVFLVANLFGFGAVLVSRFGRVQPPAAGSL
jgi:cytoskeletal protein CcmA (bactofilin family)